MLNLQLVNSNWARVMNWQQYISCVVCRPTSACHCCCLQKVIGN